MAELFLEYGLFLLKTITIIMGIVLGLGSLVGIVASRKKSPETLKVENINDKYKDYQETLEFEILDKDEFKQLTKQRKKEAKAEKKSAKLKNKAQLKSAKNKANKDTVSENCKDFDLKHKLFVLNFTGDIQASETENLREEISAILSIATPNDEVLINIDSGGGIVHDYGFAASQLSRIKNKSIPLTAAVDLVAASGGYMMACVADKIIAAPFAVVGSIGVIAQIPNLNRLLEKNKIDIELHTAGEYKRTLTTLGKNTNEGRAKFKEELEETHTLFKKFVKENREILDIDSIATGEHWYGMDALEKKLIDQIMTSDDYIMSKLDTMDIFEITYEINESFKDKISSAVGGSIRIIYKNLLTLMNKKYY